jgi:NAD(P)H-dependent FMN reductase
MTRLQIIVGSTRADRAADHVLPWVVDRASAHGSFEVEVLDLRDWPLPMFAETIATIGDFSDPTFSDPIVKAWNTKIGEGEAFLFITPEYNHSVPGVLKNAIDNVFLTMAFRNKPGAFVGYSGGQIAGARAVEHLAHIAIEVEMIPLRDTVLIGGVGAAFDEESNPVNPMSDVSLTVMLDDLAWWAELMTPARLRQLPPGKFRVMQAMAAR